MSASRRCPDCGSSEIVEDAHYSQEQLVCADCGYILTEGALTTTHSEESFLQAVPLRESTGQNETISRSKLRGIIRVRHLCRVLRLPDTFADAAVSYYESAFYLPLCHSVRKEKKEAVLGCCVYLTCRQHRWPLTLATISSMLYSKYELLSSVFMDLVQALKVDVPLMSIQDLAKSHCQSFRLFQDCQSAPTDYAENLDRILDRTSQLLELASETWLITGRQPIPMITAAVYLSWQSHKPAQRWSCPFLRFCKLSETELPSPAVKRLKELKESCIKLASQLPWLKATLNKKTVVYHLGDILKHKNYLLRKALEAVEMSSSESEECESSAQQSPVAPFLPPCMAKPRKRQHSTAFPNNLHHISGDEDISDSEIEQYLRTPAEMACFQQAQAQLDGHQ
ncbi:transcription factor IIIB 50 kDa subunit [Eleutherodactylus coqui]|uniref:transcription factor IIIB 50 kDa subunit n=1 Tax=Eleutherodactylus coqui TaxID=57060 RepID=UPI0034618972